MLALEFVGAAAQYLSGMLVVQSVTRRWQTQSRHHPARRTFELVLLLVRGEP